MDKETTTSVTIDRNYFPDTCRYNQSVYGFFLSHIS